MKRELSKRESEILETLQKKVLVKKLYNKPILIKRNINLSELAKEMGVSRSYIHQSIRAIKGKGYNLPEKNKIIIQQEIK
jgi:DNA-binding MarR family transcriptional regulator